ncbi:MAG: hypothetical protein KME08_08545 [Aphanothece sp. CMT-3BRIN-NPC111]|jgi:hypothetical protein|nr:hypothetical protein [Aphanothece sp. CMT-3BRIN-NPC111]
MSQTALIRKPIFQPTQILNQLQSGQILKVEGDRGSALILCHPHHAELAGPGAAVGGMFDLHCSRIIPIGKVSMVYLESSAERQQAYATREQWIRLTQKAMESYVPLQRARTLLLLLEKYFNAETVSRLPDEILAQLVGVLPKTLRMARPRPTQSQSGNLKQDLQLVTA